MSDVLSTSLVCQATARPPAQLIARAAARLVEFPPAPRTMRWVTVADVAGAPAELAVVYISQLSSEQLHELVACHPGMLPLVSAVWPDHTAATSSASDDLDGEVLEVLCRIYPRDRRVVLGPQQVKNLVENYSAVLGDDLADLDVSVTAEALDEVWELLTSGGLPQAQTLVVASAAAALLQEKAMSVMFTDDDPRDQVYARVPVAAFDALVAALEHAAAVSCSFECDDQCEVHTNPVVDDVANLTAELCVLYPDHGLFERAVQLCVPHFANALFSVAEQHVLAAELFADVLCSLSRTFARVTRDASVLDMFAADMFATPTTHDVFTAVVEKFTGVHTQFDAAALVAVHEGLVSTDAERAARFEMLARFAASSYSHPLVGLLAERLTPSHADLVAPLISAAVVRNEPSETHDRVMRALGAAAVACGTRVCIDAVDAAMYLPPSSSRTPLLLRLVTPSPSYKPTKKVISSVASSVFAPYAGRVKDVFSHSNGDELLAALAAVVAVPFCDAARWCANEADLVRRALAGEFAAVDPASIPNSVCTPVQVAACVDAGVFDVEQFTGVLHAALCDNSTSVSEVVGALAAVFDAVHVPRAVELFAAVFEMSGNPAAALELWGRWVAGGFALNQPTPDVWEQLAASGVSPDDEPGDMSWLVAFVCDTHPGRFYTAAAREAVCALPGLPARLSELDGAPIVSVLFELFEPSELVLAVELAAAFPGSLTDLVDTVAATRPVERVGV